MKIIFFILLFFSFFFFSIGQENHSERQIKQLKESVLLVRLKDRKKEIEYYKKYDNYQEANAIKNKQEEINNLIIRAFKNHFDFCPVYFFYSSESTKLLKEGINNISIFNFEKQIVPTDALSSFFIAEFAAIRDTDGTTSSSPALIIMDNKFNQLEKPFPYNSLIPIFLSKEKK